MAVILRRRRPPVLGIRVALRQGLAITRRAMTARREVGPPRPQMASTVVDPILRRPSNGIEDIVRHLAVGETRLLVSSSPNAEVAAALLRQRPPGDLRPPQVGLVVSHGASRPVEGEAIAASVRHTQVDLGQDTDHRARLVRPLLATVASS